MASPQSIETPPLSCLTCRQRKIKCDKQSPCSNCLKSKFSCSYPTRARTRSKKAASSLALKSRLEKLEDLVENLKKSLSKCGPTAPVANGNGEVFGSSAELGRLETEGEEMRYIENSFWVTLSDEVSGIKQLLDDGSDEDSESIRLDSNPTSSTGGQAYFFSFNSLSSSISSFHPSPDLIMIHWVEFVNRVDPVIRMLHKPTMQKKIAEAKDNIVGVSKPFESLMFSIYFASVSGMSGEDCLTHFGESKEVLVNRYRFAVQQSLARSNFLSTHNVVVLQALTIYLICERNHDSTPLVWTLTSVAIRIAQSLGLHRDGSYLGLPVFETEIRRRLWWQICILDIRASEYHGSEQDVVQQNFDTKVPLNIDDDALIPGSLDAPIPQEGITGMSLWLIRYETVAAISRLKPQLASSSTNNRDTPINTVEQIDQITEECRTILEHRFLRHCNMEVPWHWLVATAARMMLARMWVHLHHQFRLQGFRDPEGFMSQKSRDRLFPASVEIVESCLLLERHEPTKQWRWCFQNFVPWQTMSFILSELCVRDDDEESDRAWKTVQNGFDRWAEFERTKRQDLLWLRMQKLFEKVRRLRAAETNGVSPIERAMSYQGHSAESTTISVRNDMHINVGGSALPQTNGVGLYVNHFRSPAPNVSNQGGSQWQYGNLNRFPDIGGDAFSQFNWGVEMDLPPNPGSGDVPNGDLFEPDNWW